MKNRRLNAILTHILRSSMGSACAHTHTKENYVSNARSLTLRRRTMDTLNASLMSHNALRRYAMVMDSVSLVLRRLRRTISFASAQTSLMVNTVRDARTPLCSILIVYSLLDRTCMMKPLKRSTSTEGSIIRMAMIRQRRPRKWSSALSTHTQLNWMQLSTWSSLVAVSTLLTITQ
jgi:hypothetical protein